MWGDSVDTWEEKLREAVRSTAGQVLTSDGKLISAMYHSSSAGTTASSQTLYGSAQPCLLIVESPEVPEERSYTFSAEEAREKLEALSGTTLTGQPDTWLTDVVLSDNRVKSLSVGGTVCTGRAFRGALGLSSTCFTWQWDGAGGLTIVCLGNGHGAGMSQMGAKVYALEGRDYLWILSHYYSGAKCVEWAYTNLSGGSQ